MDKVQLKRMRYIIKNIPRCRKCSLRNNGMAIPYFSEHSKYLIFAEAPGRDEVQEENKTPLVGAAGKKLFFTLGKYKFKREEFVIINSTNCRPVNDKGGNGKPSKKQIEACRFWNDRIIEVFDPKIIIALGNYAMGYLTGKNSGITKICGTIIEQDGRIIIPCLHPASVLYDFKNTKVFLKGLRAFKEIAKG